jgi:23S rRNA pseudouridine2605 synthase
MAEERVQKILARAGYGSRRASEELIAAGRVKVNGQPAVLGSKADPQHDTITVDNQQVAVDQVQVYIALNKPQYVLSEVSPEESRETVRDLVPVPGHLFIVGRLDLESEGLILLTNDGELANKLTHPRYGHEKEYRVLFAARPDTRQIDAWRHGIVLEDGYRTQPAQIRLEAVAGKGAWMRVVLREGRKRQIREMGWKIGLPVLRIQRIRIGSLLLGEMKPGEWRHLRPEEVRALKVNKPYREEGGGPSVRSTRPVRRAPRTDRPPRSEERSRSTERPGSTERTHSEDRPRPGGRPVRSGERTNRSEDRPSRAPANRPTRSGSRPPRPGDRPRTRKP